MYKLHIFSKKFKSKIKDADYRNFLPFTRTADYPHQPIIADSKKKVNRLPTLVDNPHLKSKENLYKKALEFTNLKAITVSFSAMQAVVCD